MLFLEHTSYFYCTRKKIEILSPEQTLVLCFRGPCGFTLVFKSFFSTPKNPTHQLRVGDWRGLRGGVSAAQTLGSHQRAGSEPPSPPNWPEPQGWFPRPHNRDTDKHPRGHDCKNSPDRRCFLHGAGAWTPESQRECPLG